MKRFVKMAMLVGAGLAGACGSDTTAPDAAGTDYEIASFDVFGDGYGVADGPRGRHGMPIIGQLLHQAVARVRAEQGAEAAQALVAPLHALREEAAAARRAGDRELFRTKIEAAHRLAAQIIVDVLGADRAAAMITHAREKIAALDAVIATRTGAGDDVTRLTRARALASELAASAQDSLDDGNVLAAMVKAARSAHVATLAGHRPRG